MKSINIKAFSCNFITVAPATQTHVEKAEMHLEIAHRYTFGIAYVTLSIAKVYLDVISERIPARSHQDERRTERREQAGRRDSLIRSACRTESSTRRYTDSRSVSVCVNGGGKSRAARVSMVGRRAAFRTFTGNSASR